MGAATNVSNPRRRTRLPSAARRRSRCAPSGSSSSRPSRSHPTTAAILLYSACYIRLAMLAKRWHVLTAFAGGCLSTVLVVVWRADGGVAEPRDGRDRASEHEAVVPTPTAEPSVAPIESAPAAAPTSDVRVASEPASESGESLAEVLARLEAEYRERGAA